jgi:choline kinase
VTEAGTDDAVFVRSCRANGQLMVEGFQRAPKTDLEWTGIAYLDSRHICFENRFVYELLEQNLPLPAALLECFEVDTQADLARANSYVSPDVMIGQFAL